MIYVYRDQGGWYPRNLAATQNLALPGMSAPTEIGLSPGCVNVRQSPAAAAPVVACWPKGTWYETTGPPSYQDGIIWWQLQSGTFQPDGTLSGLRTVGWADQDYLSCFGASRGGVYYPGQTPPPC